MTKTGYTLVTGGLAGRLRNGRVDAVNGIVAEAARSALKDDIEAKERIMTILPEMDREFPRVVIGQVVPISHADRPMRRQSMVLKSDAVVIIGGNDGTREIATLAYFAEKPLLALPFTGKIAAECWKLYRKEIIERLRLTKKEIEVFDGHERMSDRVALVALCVNILNRMLRPHCFVAMPYSEDVLPVFEAIRVAVEQCGYQPIRIDQQRFVGSIVKEIWEQIRQADIIVADLTGYNPNVFYELGIAHALGKPAFLAIQGPVPVRPPFDISEHRLCSYNSVASLSEQLKKYLPRALQSMP